MIICQLSGGLGNQLFQWSFAYNTSMLLNLPLLFDQYFYRNQNKRKQQLSSIPNLQYIHFLDQLETSNNIPQNIITVEEKFGYLLDITKIHIQNNSTYYFMGYWQSAEYFGAVQDSVVALLQPTELSTKYFISQYHLDTEYTVGMHIRRTDYLSSDGFHVVQPIEYYQKALDLIGPYDQLLIFSDDTNWCLENLQFDKQKIIVHSYTDIENIWLMSLCHSNIIANSSFSWWGAYLNTSRNPKVIAPKQWYGNTDSSAWQHIYHKPWLVI